MAQDKGERKRPTNEIMAQMEDLDMAMDTGLLCYSVSHHLHRQRADARKTEMIKIRMKVQNMESAYGLQTRPSSSY